MDKEERGRLLVEQEDTQQAIADLEKQLKQHGAYLSPLVNALRSNPSSIRFTNVPTEIIADMPKQSSTASLDWNKIPDKEAIVRLVVELQKKKADLQRIQAALKGQVKPS